MERNELHCGELIKRIHDTMERNANNGLQSHDITITQFKMLMVLHWQDNGTATLKELEKYFNVAQSTMAGIVARLEKKKLIEGFTDAADKRIKLVQITEAGKQICLGARESMEENERRLLAGLTPEEQEQFFVLLNKVYNTLE